MTSAAMSASTQPKSHQPKGSKARRKAAAADMQRFQQVLGIPAFREDPIAAVGTYVRNVLPEPPSSRDREGEEDEKMLDS